MESSTETAQLEQRDTTIKLSDMGLFFVALCLSLFITSANATTIVAIWRTPALRTLANTYVCSLACADVVVGVVCILLALFMLPPLRISWFDQSAHLCSVLNGMNIGMTTVSAFNMTLIAFDRYLYIVKPYFYQRVVNIRVIGVSVGIAWVSGLVVGILPHFVARQAPVCHTTDRLPVWYLFYMVTVLYLFTCVVNIVLYSVILRVASKQHKAVMANMASVRTSKDRDGQRHGANFQLITKATMKSIKFFLTVFGCFFCCITPMVIVLALDIYIEIPFALYTLLNVVALINSAMNFIIYAVMNKQFRAAFLKTSALAKCGARLDCHKEDTSEVGDDNITKERKVHPRPSIGVTSFTDV